MSGKTPGRGGSKTGVGSVKELVGWASPKRIGQFAAKDKTGDTGVHRKSAIVAKRAYRSSTAYWLNLIEKKDSKLREEFEKLPKKQREKYRLFRNSSLTARHSMDMAYITGMLIRACMRAKVKGTEKLDDNQIRKIIKAAALHDVAKIRWNLLMFLKPLSEFKETELVLWKEHAHSEQGLLLNAGVEPEVVEMAIGHHTALADMRFERAQEVDFGTKVIQVADKFTALSEPRGYYRRGYERKGKIESKGVVRYMWPSIKRIMLDEVKNGNLDRQITTIMINMIEHDKRLLPKRPKKFWK